MSPPRPSALHAELQQRAIGLLKSAFQAAGWSVSAEAGDELQVDLSVERNGQAFAVVLQVSPDRSRRSALRGRLADALLMARARGKELQAAPLAILFAPAISNRLAGDLAAYVQRVAPDMAWGLVDERGRFELHHEALNNIAPPEPVLEALESPRSPEAHNPFSDLGQWLVKVLLAKHVPEPWLNAPRQPIHGISELAQAAGVSQPSASRLINALKAQGYVARRQRGFRVMRPDALLRAWQHASAAPVEHCFARRLLPGGDLLANLEKALARHAGHAAKAPAASKAPQAWHPIPSGPIGQRACLSHFAACQALGLSIVRRAPVHLFSEDLSQAALAALDLIRVDHPAEAELVVVRPRFPESVFRGAVAVQGAPAADALQCWLDVALHPARGEEQAAALADRLDMQSWAQ